MTNERYNDFMALADRCIAIARRPRSGEPMASGVRGKPEAKGQWDKAIEAALVQCNGNRQRAVALVAKQQPQLRQQLVAQANKPASRPTAKASSAEEFKKEVQALIDDGMDKVEAVKLLSQQMGLTEQPATREGNQFWSNVKKQYGR